MSKININDNLFIDIINQQNKDLKKMEKSLELLDSKTEQFLSNVDDVLKEMNFIKDTRK